MLHGDLKYNKLLINVVWWSLFLQFKLNFKENVFKQYCIKILFKDKYVYINNTYKKQWQKIPGNLNFVNKSVSRHWRSE